MPQATRKATSRCRAGGKVRVFRTGSGSREAGTATTIASLPIARPAANGWTPVRSSKRRRRRGERLAAMRTAPVQCNRVSNATEACASRSRRETQRAHRGPGRKRVHASSRILAAAEGGGCSTGSLAPVRVRVSASGAHALEPRRRLAGPFLPYRGATSRHLGVQPTAPAVAFKSVRILKEAFPIYRCHSRRGGG